ncbi:hypothetical protein C8Q79DRAFT_17724 [Trametes meyenii]|nr:hypothetical protein C8Q79DRAFT_17724 [Trametes meyenii]
MNLKSTFSNALPALFLGSLCQLLALPVAASPVSVVLARQTDDLPTNLPPPSYNGTFVGNASIIINAPIETVWDVLLNFTDYPAWNPFVRSQVITDKSHLTPLADQTPVEGAYFTMHVHLPATLDDSVPTLPIFEQISHIEEDKYRASWINLSPEWFLKSERWQALSVTPDGRTYYESREVFASPGALAIKWFIADNLEKSFAAQAEALKAYSEQK